MAVGSTSGAKLFIAPPGNIPFSPDLYVEIGEINDLGSVGPNYTPITTTSIGNRNERTFKGTRTGSQYTIKLNRDPDDLGQAALAAAVDSDDDHQFKITLNDAIDGNAVPTTITFEAKVMSYTVDMGTINNVVQSTVNLAMNPATYDEVFAH